MQINRSRPLYDQAYQALRAAILEGQIGPGEHLVETRLADMLNISRTPIRESIRQLERDGLVDVTAHDGAYVRRPDRQDLVNLYECRTALERLAANRAAQRRTQQDIDAMHDALALAEQATATRNPITFLECNSRFHRAITISSHNDRLDELSERARSPLLPYRAILVRHGAMAPAVLEGIHTEHLGLFSAIRSGDPELAERVMEQHMRSDLTRILGTLEDLRTTEA